MAGIKKGTDDGGLENVCDGGADSCEFEWAGSCDCSNKASCELKCCGSAENDVVVDDKDIDAGTTALQHRLFLKGWQLVHR